MEERTGLPLVESLDLGSLTLEENSCLRVTLSPVCKACGCPEMASQRLLEVIGVSQAHTD